MSDWELDNGNSGENQQPQSDWEVVHPDASSMQPQDESFGQAALKAVPRIGEDLYRKAFGALKEAPEYWEKYKTELPGFWKNIFQHPGSMAMQGLAGANEAINAVNQLPLQLAQYGNERLNLLPKSVPNAIKNIIPEDTTESINQLFDKPQRAGESLLRGTMRNLPSLIPSSELASIMNPRNLTHSGIARNIVQEQNRQIGTHSRLYNNLFRDAERAGINEVPISNHLIDSNLNFIRQYKSPRDYRSLENFRENPTLQNAQSATSDLKVIMRSLDEKSKKSSLTSEERHLYDAADHTVRHIENNMFLNPQGELNHTLSNRHSAINHSYRENVVPYRYNKNIQDYIDRKITPTQLVNSLSTGEFAVKKGRNHPAIKIRNSIPKAVLGTGSLGGVGWLLEQMFGNNQTKQ
jgi:hypothetical protein